MPKPMPSIASQVNEKLGALAPENLARSGVDGFSAPVPAPAPPEAAPAPGTAPEATAPAPTLPLTDPNTAPPAPQAAATEDGGDPNAAPEALPVAAQVAPAPAVGAQVAAPDPFAEYEEVEYDDPDQGRKFTVRAPKTYAAEIRNGYARKSIMDRHATYLSKWRPLLEPLVTSGAFDQIAPVLQAATTDAQLADAVGEMWARYLQGRPIAFADSFQQPQAQAPVAQAVAPAAQAPATDLDPFTAQIVEQVNRAMDARLTPVQQMLQQQEAERQAGIQAQQQYQQTQARANQLAQQIEYTLRSYFPQTFVGDPARDGPTLQRVAQYVRDAGMNQFAPESYVAAVYRMMGDTPQVVNPAAASPGARSVAEARAQGEALAAAAAAQVASGIGGGTAAAPAAPARGPRKVETRGKDGVPLPVHEVAARVLRQLQRDGQG